MSQLEAIRHQFHDLIDQVDDESVLARYLGAISSEVKGETTDLWDDLMPEEQADILEAIRQTDDSSKVISHEEAIKRHAPWRIQ